MSFNKLIKLGARFENKLNKLAQLTINQEDQDNVFDYIKKFYPNLDTGLVDGKLGPKTRRAITKSKMQLKISPYDQSTDQVLFDKLKDMKNINMF